MKVYVFGNQDIKEDNKAILVAKALEKKLPGINFIYHDPNEGFDPNDKNLVILDTAFGVDRVKVIDNLDSVKLTHSVSLHDFDLGFSLKLLKKLKKIDTVKIVAIPAGIEVEDVVGEVGFILQSILSPKSL